MKATPFRPNYQSSLLLFWIVGFTAFNFWFLRLPYYNARYIAYKPVSVEYSYDMGGINDDDLYDAENMPWERDSELDLHSEDQTKLAVTLSDLNVGERGKIAWLMRYVCMYCRQGLCFITFIVTCSVHFTQQNFFKLLMQQHGI